MSAYENYKLWLKFLKRTTFNKTEGINRELCHLNENLVDKGCSILVPLCQKVKVRDQAQGWDCKMKLWEGCLCSKPYPWVFKYIIPPYKDCYNNLIHSSDEIFSKSLKLPSGSETDSRDLLLPVGECYVSYFFLLYIVVLACLLYVTYRIGYKLVTTSFSNMTARFLNHKTKKSSVHTSALLQTMNSCSDLGS